MVAACLLLLFVCLMCCLFCNASKMLSMRQLCCPCVIDSRTKCGTCSVPRSSFISSSVRDLLNEPWPEGFVVLALPRASSSSSCCNCAAIEASLSVWIAVAFADGLEDSACAPSKQQSGTNGSQCPHAAPSASPCPVPRQRKWRSMSVPGSRAPICTWPLVPQ